MEIELASIILLDTNGEKFAVKKDAFDVGQLEKNPTIEFCT